MFVPLSENQSFTVHTVFVELLNCKLVLIRYVPATANVMRLSLATRDPGPQ